ncbi:hypothetical protein LAV82_23120 [Bacillus sp. ILBB4]|nr:hypothetical protein [Bacillus sp. ILBB4]
MLESLFSVQAVQPFLAQAFSPFKEAHEDRLFKHITFFEEDSDLTIRLLPVDRENIIRSSSSVTQKSISTNNLIVNPQTEVFRIKAVLSEADHAVTESSWVTQKNMDSTFASSHNQYRLRGVTKENWKSDWVYSELRDFDNDLIVYNMIYDVLDLMLSVHDNQIDYLMDYIVSDTFIELMGDMKPNFSYNLDYEENKAASMSDVMSFIKNKEDSNPRDELVSQLGEKFLFIANELKSQFKEVLTSSPEEFAQLYKVYKLIDQYQERKVDFMSLLVEIFLEDRLEKIVRSTNIEVLLQNDEEMSSYLNSSYEFDIKNELITAIYDASLNDGFVTNLNDAVELISEPVILEALRYSKDESIERFLRMALSDLYVPMLAVDRHLLELEAAVEDKHEQSVQSSIVEFSLLEDDVEIKNMLLFDVVDAVIKTDLEPIKEYHAQIIDHIFKSMNDSRMKLLVDYNFDEVLTVTLNVAETFKSAYVKEFGHANENVHVQSSEGLQHSETTSTRSFKESYLAALSDIHRMQSIASNDYVKELKATGILESITEQFSLFKEVLNEILEIGVGEEILKQPKIDSSILSELLNALQLESISLDETQVKSKVKEYLGAILKEYADSNRITATDSFKEHFHSSKNDGYYNLFKHYLRNPNKFPLLDRKLVELSHNLRDIFLMDGTDQVHYAIGAMDEGWPVGQFKLGINTLKGEVSSS